jgi:pyridoxal phosphate enzyme (YggS family)
MIQNNVQQVLQTMQDAAEHSPYEQNVKLVAVTKNRTVDEMKQVYACGIRDFGENRVQELLEKYSHFDSSVTWHLIGTLQRNKVKYIIDKVALIHSVDHLKLAQEIDRQAEKHALTAQILIQVNVAKEESKHGFEEEELTEVLTALSGMKHLSVRGMMMIAPNSEDVGYLDSLFEKTRNIFDNLVKTSKKYDNMSLDILSMGMTHDYQLAIKHGSNMVRIGRALFN